MTIVSMTTARAQRLAQYPKTVLELASLLGILPEAAADSRIETRLAIARQLETAMVKEREQGEIWTGPRNYDFDRHMDLAEALGIELYGIARRAAELSEHQAHSAAEIVRRNAA